MLNFTAQPATYFTLLAQTGEEQHDHEGNFFKQFCAIFSDPAHALVENFLHDHPRRVNLGAPLALVRKFINSNTHAAHRESMLSTALTTKQSRPRKTNYGFYPEGSILTQGQA